MDFRIALPVIAYLGLLFYLSYRLRDKHSTDQSYYRAGGRIKTFAALLSVIATETSVATILVFPAEGYRAGLQIWTLCAGYMAGRTLVGFFYLSRIHSAGSVSVYDLVSGPGRARQILESGYLLAKYLSSGARFFLGGYGLSQLLGGSSVTWIIIMALLAGLYSVSGGLRAVVVTDQIQGWILFLSGIAIAVFAVSQSGSVSGPVFQAKDFFSTEGLFSGSGALALLTGGLVLSIGSHGTDQDMLQRILGVRDFKNARTALILSGPGAAFVILIYAAIGMILFQLYPQLALDEKSPLVSYVNYLNNPYITGFFAVLMLAAAMSTIDSAIHSTSAVWKSLTASERPGRLFSVLSLIVLVLFGTGFSFLHEAADDFLSLAMGSMLFVYTGLIAIFTFFTFTGRPLSGTAILSSMLTGFTATCICYLFDIKWTWTAILGSVAALIVIIAGSRTGRSTVFSSEKN